MQDHREHVAYSLSQPSPVYKTHSQCDLPIVEQSRENTTRFPTSQVKSTTHPISPNSTEQWQTINKKGTEKLRNTIFPLPPPKKTGYWLGEAIPTTNRFSTLEEETPTGDLTQNTAPKPPPIFILGVTNIKPLIELLNALAPNKYLVITLPNDQMKVQPTGSSIYTAIIKALMDKNTEFHTYKPRQDRRFRVVLKNIHPSTDINNIKQALKDEGHEVTNI
jgi:hypothetical protein